MERERLVADETALSSSWSVGRLHPFAGLGRRLRFGAGLKPVEGGPIHLRPDPFRQSSESDPEVVGRQEIL